MEAWECGRQGWKYHGRVWSSGDALYPVEMHGLRNEGQRNLKIEETEIFVREKGSSNSNRNLGPENRDF